MLESIKIDINSLKVVPSNISTDFCLCIYGDVPTYINTWSELHNIRTYTNGKYTNFVISDVHDIQELFVNHVKYKYLDGFSPNLNKKLHIGHFSNLVIGKAFKSLGIAEKTFSIYGDTVGGDVSTTSSINYINTLRHIFNYKVDAEYLASQMVYNGNLLVDGTDEYTGTKVFNIPNGNKVVGIKSDGSTSYFYQDVALANILSDTTLYLTGSEQIPHFYNLNSLYPQTNHVGLGLVTLNGKMSTRRGNVVLIDDFMLTYLPQFNNDAELVYNIFAGFILKSEPISEKKINEDMIDNPKTSLGLYISYTMARLYSAGCVDTNIEKFDDNRLNYAYLKSQYNLKPNILFDAVVDLCKKINNLYKTNHIQNNIDNEKMFNVLLSDLALGVEKLGMFKIRKV